MSRIQVIASYPEEGFEVLEDDAGKFLVLKEQEDIVPIHDLTEAFVIPYRDYLQPMHMS